MRMAICLALLVAAVLVIGLHFGYGAEQRFEKRFCDDPAVCGP